MSGLSPLPIQLSQRQQAIVQQILRRHTSSQRLVRRVQIILKAHQTELAEKFSRTTERPITYHRFSDSLLEQNAFLGELAKLVDQGRLAGNADIASLRADFPELLTMDEWLAGAGRPALLAAIQANGGEVALR